MPLSYSQFVWGFEVFDSGSKQNNKLPFKDNGTSYTATLHAGVYTADEFAAEVEFAMQTATANGNNTCEFDYTTLKFTLTGVTTLGVFELLFDHTTLYSVSCAELLGFTKGDGSPTTDENKTGAASYTSEEKAGTAPSSASSWAVAEPLAYTSPVTPQPITAVSPTKGTSRLVGTVQHVSDGGSVESVHFATLRMVQIAFRALADGGEQAKMESFLDWIALGNRFTWQPDKTSENGMKLVLANPGMIANTYEWLARPEVGYATLTFFEQN